MTAIRELEAELAQEKEEMAASLDGLRDATHEALDWRTPVRERPLQAVAIAAAIGIGVGVLSLVANDRPRSGRRGASRSAASALTGIASLLLPAIASPLAAYVERQIRGVVGLAHRTRR